MAKFVVCPSCGGEGTHGPGFVYTSDDIAEQFGGDMDEFMSHVDDIRAGHFDTPCDYCKGQRVVPAKNKNGVTAEEAWRDHCEYEAERAAEARMCGYY